jgi:putative component of membrane protein insertase Oxa1/YidC/SpoIIIJ protein YidD
MRQRLSIKGAEYEDGDPGLQAALARVYGRPDHPKCLCVPGGVEMVVARYAEYVLKRFPDSGPRHHPMCPSYDVEASESGRGELLGSAITEHSAAGWEIRTKFPLTRVPGRAVVRGATGTPTEVKAGAKAASMLALLHELWERAGFNRWYPAMRGKRSWGVIRAHLLAEASRAKTKNQRLSDAMLLAEPFDKQRAAAQQAVRRELLVALGSPMGDVQHRLLIVVGELKEAEESALGIRLRLKHMSEVALLVDAPTWARTKQAFDTQLRVHESDDSTRLIVAGLVYSPADQTYALDQLTFMLTTASWIPIEDGNDNELVKRLTEQGRRFLRPLRYDSKRWGAFANAKLLDTGDKVASLHILSERLPKEVWIAKKHALAKAPDAWVWNAGEPIPPFPPAACRHAPTCSSLPPTTRAESPAAPASAP